MTHSVVRGVVASFDEAVGLGTIRDAGGVIVDFHCIAIADGTRTIAPSTPVTFRRSHRFGRDEAIDITS